MKAPPVLSSGVRPLPRLFARALVWTLGRMPAGARDLLARMIGRLAHGLGIRRKVVWDNLAHAFPERSEAERRAIAAGAYVNMARAVLESLCSNRLRNEDLERVLDADTSALDAALAEGRGVVVATAHFGSWELLGEVMTRRGYPVNAVVRPLEGAINEQVIERRLESGMKLIPPKGALDASRAALKRGEMVVVLIDQALPSPKALFVPFFGRLASTTPTAALAAIRAGAPALVGLAARDGSRLRLWFEGPFRRPQEGSLRANLHALTAEMTAAIERGIRRYPDQWLWLHRRWKVPPPERASKTERPAPPEGARAEPHASVRD